MSIGKLKAISLSQIVMISALMAAIPIIGFAMYFLAGLSSIRNLASDEIASVNLSNQQQMMAISAEQMSRHGRQAITAISVADRKNAMEHFNKTLATLKKSELKNARKYIETAGKEVHRSAKIVKKRYVIRSRIEKSRKKSIQIILAADNLLGSAIEDSSSELEDAVKELSSDNIENLSDSKEDILTARTRNTASYTLLKTLGNLRDLVLHSTSMQDEKVISKSITKFEAISRRIEPLLEEMPTTGDFEDLGELTSGMISLKAVFDLRKQELILMDSAVKGIDKAQKTLQLAANTISDNANGAALNSVLGAEKTSILVEEMFKLAMVASAVILTILLVLIFAAHQAILLPIRKASTVFLSLVGGDLDAKMPSSRIQELKSIGEAAFKFSETLKQREEDQKKIALEAEREHKNNKKRELIAKQADSFASDISKIVEHVFDATNDIGSASKSLLVVSDQTNSLASDVTISSKEVAANIQLVSAATIEMNASVNEIRAQVEDSNRTATAAVSEVSTTQQKIQDLSDAINRVDEFTAIINEIAEQTNLLALNATIEAARAGEAGRGFTIVAQEVKELAKQTAKATSDIGIQIKNIQGVTNDTVSTIDNVQETISHLQGISSTISAAIEQQSATTEEIAQSIEQVSTATQQVTQSISSVSDGAKESKTISHQFSDITEVLTKEAKVLRSEVHSFISKIQAG